jgi:acrylyl-CoA reductase (NADPH)
MRAFVVTELDAQLHCGVSETEPAATDADDVLVRVDYSGVNYKDALVAAVPSRVRRVASLVGGVDAAGVVVMSSDAAVSTGTRVVVHGSDLGVGRDGGFAEFVYVPTRFVNVLPEELSTRDAMVIGTAGFTAMASVLALEDHGLKRDGEVLVTGATGGVGSLAISLLRQRGYQPVASTGSTQESAWLLERGATRVIGRDDISDRPERVLGGERWAGAVDCIGGATLHQILRSLRYGGAVAASGLVAGTDLATTVYPFITRAVSLLGIDAVEARRDTRERVWSALGEMAPLIDFAPLIDREVVLEELNEALDVVRRGATRGRILVTPQRRWTKYGSDAPSSRG